MPGPGAPAGAADDFGFTTVTGAAGGPSAREAEPAPAVTKGAGTMSMRKPVNNAAESGDSAGGGPGRRRARPDPTGPEPSGEAAGG
eukprot:5271289-Heterocapsa_arctica.AAC.1